MHKIEFNRVVLLAEKPLIGMRASMTRAADATPALWQRFMPRRGEVANAIGESLYSVQLFSGVAAFENFTPDTVFEKWAAVEVDGTSGVPDGMESLSLSAGHYAVFDHQGPPGEFAKSLYYIFVEWLPQSEWQLDDRPHFEVLQPGWRADDPEAREEVWIPVRQAGSEEESD